MITHTLSLFATACQSVTGTSCSSGLPAVQVTGGSHGTIQEVLTILFAIIGALAVLMIVIGGMRFVTGSTSPQETAKARATLVYALAGLLIALAAESIVNLVMSHL